MKRWGYMLTAFSIAGMLVFTFFWLADGAWASANTPQRAAGVQAPVGTSFTYQGELLQGGSPANGRFDFRFRLFDAATVGSQVGPTVTKDDVQVTNDRFTVVLDFGGNVFQGDARWLEIAVRPGNSTGAYTTLSPRQAVNPVPYAIYAARTSNDHHHFGQTWQGASQLGLTVYNKNTRGTSILGLNGLITGVNELPNEPVGIAGVVYVGPGYIVTTPIGVWGSAYAIPAPPLFESEPTTGVVGIGTRVGVRGETVGVVSDRFSFGVIGRTNAPGGAGVEGIAKAAYFYRRPPYGPFAVGVSGITYNDEGAGVYAYSAYTGTAQSHGLVAETDAPNGYAGLFKGNVDIRGRLTKQSGAFKIDHPLDPANKYLYHSFVESPDMKNIYDGVVVLDEKGEAWVELPEWFEALNKDFRYQLTPIGAPMPGLYIAEEIKDNRFKIAGGVPGKKVSWQVTGIRNDPYARDNRIPVEVEKPERERGRYLYPEGYNQPPEKAIDYPLFSRYREVLGK